MSALVNALPLRVTTPILLAFALAAFAATPVTAQTPVQTFGAGIAFERYSFADPQEVDIESLSLFTVPITGRVGLGRRLALGVRGAFASAQLVRADGSDATLSGLTDTQVTLRLEIGRNAAAITAIGLLPTGSTSLDDDEIEVAGAIAADVLPFRISSWGTGGGGGLAFSAARPIGGGFVGGLSLGYVVARSFQPLSGDDFEYRPGDQMHVRAAVDHTIGNASKVSLAFTFQRYGEDESDGVNLFQTGDRIQTVGTLNFGVGARANGLLYTGWMRRTDGEYRQPSQLLPAQDLVYGGAGLRVPVGSAILQPSAELRVLAAGGGAGKGYTLATGLSVEMPVAGWTVIPTARARFGSAEVEQGGSSGFTGFELALTTRPGGIRW